MQTSQQAIVQAFKASQAADRAELAVDILQDIFQPHALDLKQFLQKYAFTHAQRDHFTSYLLYGIYYNEIVPSQANELLFLTLAAEVLEEQDCKKILQILPLQMRFQLMAYCLLQPREGAWYIMESFEELFQQDAQWLEFIQLLKTYYYSPQYLQAHTDLPFDQLVLGLKNLAHSQIQQIHKLLPELIDLIITAPRRGALLIAELKRQLTGQDSEMEIDQATLQAEKNMQNLLQKYQSISYTIEEYSPFFKIFGLQNHYLNTPITADLQTPLSTVLERIKGVFLEPIHTPIEHINNLVLLIERICQELYAFTKEPAIYTKGLQNLVYSVATRSSHFTKLPWLPSVLKGLQCLSQHCQKSLMHQCPIIVFDQSNQELFDQNKVYIQSLSNQYQAIIWHLSTEQTLSLAKKWGLDHWFAEPKEGAFGYASSRNSLFLLAPVIHRATQQGCRSFDDLLALPDEQIEELFNSAVLGHDGNDAIIHTGEDDAAIPLCNIFADAFYAAKNQARYFQRASFCIGRATLLINPLIGIASIANDPSILFSSTAWLNEPKLGAMKGKLTKPRFCFPIHFGNEENHVSTPQSSVEFFQQPILHLGGSRFPKKLIPEHPLDGIREYLAKYIPYSLEIALSSFVLDSSHKRGRCMLPWNDRAFKASLTAHSLGSLWEFISKPETLESFHKQFWINFKAVFDKDNENIFLISILNSLIHPNFTLEVPLELKVLYTSIQRDAQFFLELGKLINQHHAAGSNLPEDLAKSDLEKKYKIRLQSFPLTYELYLFAKCMIHFGDNDKLRKK